MARDESSENQQQSAWDRAYREVERSREEHTRPDTSQFADLTKSAGGSK